jgi:hypothetical protein
MKGGAIGQAVTGLEQRIKQRHGSVTRVFVEAQSFEAHRGLRHEGARPKRARSG